MNQMEMQKQFAMRGMLNHQMQGYGGFPPNYEMGQQQQYQMMQGNFGKGMDYQNYMWNY